MLLDSSVKPLMLGKVVIKSFGLIDVDFYPCLYQTLTSMGGSKKVRKVNQARDCDPSYPNKLADDIIVQPRVVVSYDILVGGMIFGKKLHTIASFGKQKLITRFHC
jgi:hypothetical protein